MKMIDLRSDTVTKPSKEMLNKVLEAEFGDDEYKEDPTVNSLEEYCANLMGFEDGLFVTSGLMGNQISLLVHTNPGEEVITSSDSHIKNYEHGAAAFLSRIQFRDLQTIDGVYDLDNLSETIKESKINKPLIKVLTVENTHLASGGSIIPFSHIKSLSEISKSNEMKLHVDGARIWHAILENPDSIKYGQYCDSLTFCFSKGLGAPVGSMLLGTSDFIAESREFRKKLGGGMRQVGIIASAARYSIENRSQLIDDHKKAEFVFSSINIENTSFNKVSYKGTNMLFFAFDSEEKAEKFRLNLIEKDVISGYIKKEVIRLVFHKDINSDELESIVDAVNYSSSLDI
tara:strand:+ start:2783 stop:3814 length:1032 start_codon:yes stop_codon:yes gene_type:complete